MDIKVFECNAIKESLAILACYQPCYQPGDEHIYPNLRSAVMDVINCRWRVYENARSIDLVNLLYARERAKSLYRRYQDMRRRYVAVK
jgi:hypothetical protein